MVNEANETTKMWAPIWNTHFHSYLITGRFCDNVFAHFSSLNMFVFRACKEIKDLKYLPSYLYSPL